MSTHDATAAERLTLHCIGAQFSGIGADERDALALDPEQVWEALATLAVLLPAAEAVVVATCNRTELYLVTADDPVRLDLWHRTVGRARSEGRCPASPAARYHHTGPDAATHLFRVAAGLESVELGDHEIGGQLRRARDLAVEARTVGPVLHRLFEHASQVGRRARSTTAISAGGAGIGRATAEAVARLRPDLEPPTVAVIGAGDAAGAICRELEKRARAEIHVVNRTMDRAVDLAGRHHGSAWGLEHLEDAVRGADVVVTAVHVEEPLIDRTLVDRVRRRAPRWSPLVIDTCVPRAVQPSCGLEIVGLDGLASRRQDLHRRRCRAVPAVEAIVCDASDRFGSWLRDRSLHSVIADLYREAEQVTADAVRLLDDDRSARQLRQAVRRLVHHHVVRLRAIDEGDELTGGPAR